MALKSQDLRMRIRQSASQTEKTLIRVVADTLKKLVHLYQNYKVEDIFTSFEVQTVRFRLKECLSRLMFLEPLEFGQKAEDTIWKSIFYEPIRLFKKQYKNNLSPNNSKSLLIVGFKRHILGAIAFYQKLILRLQTEFDLDKELCSDDSFRDHFPYFEIEEKPIVSGDVKNWAFNCVQRSLLYIGDLYRYELELKSLHARNMAIQYYSLVLKLNPSHGHAYNQLATLDTLSYYGLTASYFYLKAQLSALPFTQSKDNLLILFERNIKRLRNVTDREILLKKSGSNIGSYEMSSHEVKHIASMCDDVLNLLSIVLGFDRKLISDTSSAGTGPNSGVRPSILNCRTVMQMLFIASASLEIMLPNNDPDRDLKEQTQRSLFNLAHTFVLNVYGHIFNQCLVRIRDELRSSNIDMAFLFRRYEECSSNTTVVVVESDVQPDVQINSEQLLTKKMTQKKKKIALSKRLLRARRISSVSEQEDMSEDDRDLSENEQLLFDDDNDEDLSDSSDSDDDVRGFEFSDDENEEEIDFEEIHSQDEDDQIIRAIVGHNTAFGRQPSTEKDNKRSRIVKDSNVVNLEEVIFSGSVPASLDPLPPPPTESTTVVKQRHKQHSFESNKIDLSTPADSVPLPQTVVKCIQNVDILQFLTIICQSLKFYKGDSLESFFNTWRFAPYLWKHFAVMLNFCENVLDNIQYNNSNNNDRLTNCLSICGHINCSDIRQTVPCMLPEDGDIRGTFLDLSDEEPNQVRCDNVVHLTVTRMNRIIGCGRILASLSDRSGCVSGSGPILVKPISTGSLWLFSYSHNGSRTNLVSKSVSQIFSPLESNQNQIAGNNLEKEKFMREMARLRLEKELSSHSESDGSVDDGSSSRSSKSMTPSMDLTKCVYLIPDVEFICTRLDSIKSMVRTQKHIIVIPQAVLQRLDRRKLNDHGARQAIKYLESEMRNSNEHVKIEPVLQVAKPSMPCDVIADWQAIEASAVRIAKEASAKSVSVSDSVVTVLTSSADKLDREFLHHYANMKVNFHSGYHS